MKVNIVNFGMVLTIMCQTHSKIVCSLYMLRKKKGERKNNIMSEMLMFLIEKKYQRFEEAAF